MRLVEERLGAHGPGALPVGGDARAGAELRAFFQAQPDTPAKLAGFAFAVEALETGAYELLVRTARRAGDEQTAAAERILAEERTAALRVAGTWDAAAEAALGELGVSR